MPKMTFSGYLFAPLTTSLSTGFLNEGTDLVPTDTFEFVSGREVWNLRLPPTHANYSVCS